MWRIAPGQALRAHRFDDGLVLFNDLSGDTHLLGEGADHLLAALQAAPASTESLCTALAAALECARDADFDQQTQEVLAQLASLFLIERQPC